MEKISQLVEKAHGFNDSTPRCYTLFSLRAYKYCFYFFMSANMADNVIWPTTIL